MKYILMPRLGLTMEEGRIVRWLKAEGEFFDKEEILFEVETDKVTSEVPAPFSGKLIKILAGEDESVPVAQPVAQAEEI